MINKSEEITDLVAQDLSQGPLLLLVFINHLFNDNKKKQK